MATLANERTRHPKTDRTHHTCAPHARALMRRHTVAIAGETRLLYLLKAEGSIPMVHDGPFPIVRQPQRTQRPASPRYRPTSLADLFATTAAADVSTVHPGRLRGRTERRKSSARGRRRRVSPRSLRRARLNRVNVDRFEQTPGPGRRFAVGVVRCHVPGGVLEPCEAFGFGRLRQATRPCLQCRHSRS